MIVPTITLPQDRETPASRDMAPGLNAPIAFTYVYARSRDTRTANAPGQDFIAYSYDDTRIVFAVCDGVSQSFYGEIAARFLGIRLVQLLWTADRQTESAWLEALNAALHGWTAEASAEVDAKQINPTLPEMHRIALERKRQVGSESMFVAGVIDSAQQSIALCWMGDMRLWLWDKDNNPVPIPGAEWHTRERWSSKIGPKNGAVRGCILPLNEITRVTAHSDGVGSYTFAKLSQDSLNSMIDDLSATAASDDISVLDIDWTVQPHYGAFGTLATPTLHTPDPREPVLTWDAVPLAARYRVWIDDGKLPQTCEVDGGLNQHVTFFPPFDSDAGPLTLTCAVQALNDYTFPSAWSAPIQFELTGTPKRQPAAVHGAVSSAPPVPLVVPDAMATLKTVEVDPLPTQPRRPQKVKAKKSRAAAFLTVFMSVLLLIILIVAVWIAVVLNDFIQLAPGR